MSKGNSSFTEFNGLKAIEDYTDYGSFRTERSQVASKFAFGKQHSFKIKANENDLVKHSTNVHSSYHF